MPSIPDEYVPLRSTSPQQAAPAPETPSLLETAGSAVSYNNYISRSYRLLKNRQAAVPDPDFNAFDMIKGTKYESDPARFAHSQSKESTLAIMREWDEDDHSRDVLARSGWTGTVAGVGAGILDPTIFLPIAKVFQGAAMGARALRVGADVAIAGGAGAAIGEAAMYATTPEMTGGDYARNVGTATVLSGLLGTGAGALLSRGERKAIETKLHQDRIDWGNDIAPGPQPGGASVSDTRQVELVKTPLDSLPGGDPLGKLSPTRRVLNSPFVSARRALVDLAETPYIFKENAAGIATTQGPALDRSMKLEVGKARVALAETLERTFYQYKLGQDDPNILQRTASGISDLRGRNGEKATYDEFKTMIDDALRNGDQHPIPQVAEAAQFVRKAVIDPWKNRAIKAGLLPEDVDPGTAASYMTRSWNKTKLTAQRPEVVERFTNWLSGEQTRKAAIQDRLTDLSRQLDEAESEIIKLQRKAMGGSPEHMDATARAASLRQGVETELSAWKGKSANEAMSAIRARDKTAAGRAADAPRLTSADASVSKVLKRIIGSDRDMSVDELRDRASQIVDRILGSPDGRIPFDDASTSNMVAPADSARGPLASREFMIPDEQVRDFLDTDIEQTLQYYLNSVVPDVLLTERFGDVDMSEAFRKLRDEHAGLSEGANTQAARTKLKKQYDVAVSDLSAIRDRVRGTYSFSSDPYMRKWGRIAATAGKLNQTTDLGGVLLTSLPDMAGPVFQYGLTSALKNQWLPLIKQWLSPEMRKAANGAQRELKTLGVAAETFLQMRTQAVGDIFDMYKPTSRFERGIDKASNGFFIANLLTPWTDFGKWGAGMVSMNEMSNAVEAIGKGAASKKQIRKLAESGIDAAMASRIWKELSTEGGSDVIDGVRVSNSGNWQDIGARDAFEGAVSRDVDMMVITPGQEKSLLTSRSPTAALILQYKTFVQAATERLLFRGMQVRDVQVLQGYMSAIVLGMLGHAAYSLATGNEMPTTNADWIKQGMSRSGVLGWLEEANAISSKWTSGTADIYRTIGASQPGSRYENRDKLGILLGPTANKLTGLITAGGNAVNLEWDSVDTRRMRRLVPAQNLFYIRRLIDKLEKE